MSGSGVNGTGNGTQSVGGRKAVCQAKNYERWRRDVLSEFRKSQARVWTCYTEKERLGGSGMVWAVLAVGMRLLGFERLRTMGHALVSARRDRALRDQPCSPPAAG